MENNNYKTVKQLREYYIRMLANKKINDDDDLVNKNLFDLKLTMYCKNTNLDIAFYKALSQSYLDEQINLHPEQINIINMIEKNEALIVSAPTSFGKTYCIFEYIVRFKPNSVVLVVPTLALIDEYLKKIIRKYSKKFQEYKIYTSYDEENAYEDEKKIFIITHDRLINIDIVKTLKNIDFLVIDEVYKLEFTEDDRTLILNMVYYHLSKISRKYVLLAPFISEVKNNNNLPKQPVFYKTDYSPVVNDVVMINLVDDKKRTREILNLIDQTYINKEKTLVYFPTVILMYNFIKNELINYPKIDNYQDDIKSFIKWAKDEIHPDWILVKAIERGFLIHNGKIPLGTRIIQLDYFENNVINHMLCTTTLLEGVNTVTENIIITEPMRYSNKSENLSSFDFYNLVGRTGRLNKHLIGRAYYIKGPKNLEYIKEDAIKTIEFEVTQANNDMNLQKKENNFDTLITELCTKINCTPDEYFENIGSKIRYQTCLKLFESYKKNKEGLIKALVNLKTDGKGFYFVILEILKIIEERYDNKVRAFIVNKILSNNTFNIKSIMDSVNYKPKDFDYTLSLIIELKTSFIEHELYSKTKFILFFMSKDNILEKYQEEINKSILNRIENKYFINSNTKKMLRDFGIYDLDIEKIFHKINPEVKDMFELKNELIKNKYKFISDISYISKYVLNKLGD